ncbi:MAG: ABC transporter substrate-binding protein [Gammaproteobacteria bacterium]|nr:ABC transporter substrate-binding protein [Gammaproteobacteria bacterium]
MPPNLHSLLLVIVILTTAGCAREQDEAVEAGDEIAPEIKVYKASMDGAPSTIDPVQASNVYANAVVLNAFDTLYRFKYLARPYEVTANLAAGMPEISEDGLVYRIRIKQGAHFIDDPVFEGGAGREVVAEDFVYSIKRHFDTTQRPRGAWLWQGRVVGLDAWKDAGSDYDEQVEGLRALDRYTIEIRLIKPYPQLVYTLAQGYAAIVPREAVETYGREFGSRPVGSGPFRVISYDSARIVYERNTKFRQEPVDIWAEGYDPETQGHIGVEAIHGRSPPFIDRLEIHFIAENAARWNSFTKDNEIQYLTVPNEQFDNILASKDPIVANPEISEKYHMRHSVESGFVFINFNMDFPEFGYNDDPERERRNKALRCAIIKGFDWARRNESFYFGLGRVFPGIITPAVPEFDPELSEESVTLDIDGAKKLLADNGWNEDTIPEMVYGTTAGVSQRMFYEQFRGFMKKIGYPPGKVVLKQYATFGDFVKDTSNSRLPIVSKGWSLDYPDAENTLQLFYGPNGSPGSNDANYKNPEYDRLYEQSAVMLPSPERTEIYRRMNQMVIDDCIAISGLSRTRIYLWHKNVIAMPDREIVSGFYLRFVDIAAEDG